MNGSNGVPSKRGFLSWHAILLASKVTISTLDYQINGVVSNKWGVQNFLKIN